MKHLLIFFLLVLVSNNLFAALGCLKNNQVYTRPPSGLTGWTVPISDNCPIGSTTSTPYANIAGSPGSVCYIGPLALGGSGNFVNYSIENCPIDDYIPFAIVLFGGIGFFFLRRDSKYAS